MDSIDCSVSNQENVPNSNDANQSAYPYSSEKDMSNMMDYSYSYPIQMTTTSNTAQQDYTHSYPTMNQTLSNVNHQDYNHAYQGGNATWINGAQPDYTYSHQTGDSTANSVPRQGYQSSNQIDNPNAESTGAQNYDYSYWGTNAATYATNQLHYDYSARTDEPRSTSSLTASEDPQPVESSSNVSSKEAKCVICGYNAKGINYNFRMCDGCPKFFRRWYRIHGNNQDTFRCKKLKKCINLRGTDSCTFCRFQKCLKYDMDKYYDGMRPRKLVCEVCSGDLTENDHKFKKQECIACRMFFEKCVERRTVHVCQEDGNCLVDSETRAKCEHCWLRKCLNSNNRYKRRRAYICYDLKKHIKTSSIPIVVISNAAESNGVQYNQALPGTAQSMLGLSSQPVSGVKNSMVASTPFATKSSVVLDSRANSETGKSRSFLQPRPVPEKAESMPISLSRSATNATKSIDVSVSQSASDAISSATLDIRAQSTVVNSSVVLHSEPVFNAAQSIVVPPSHSVSETTPGGESCEVCGEKSTGVYNGAKICDSHRVRVKIPTNDRGAAWRCFAPSMFRVILSIDESFLERDILAVSYDENLNILREATFHLYLLKIIPGLSSKGSTLPDGRILNFNSLCLLFGDQMAEDMVFVAQFIRSLHLDNNSLALICDFVFAKFQNIKGPETRELINRIKNEIYQRVNVNEFHVFMTFFARAGKNLRNSIMPWFFENRQAIQLPENLSDMLDIPWERQEVQPLMIDYTEIGEE